MPNDYLENTSTCYSGWTIFLLLILFNILIQLVTGPNNTIASLMTVSAILFYIFQNKITSCRYPDPNA